jgi:hypothetical protein
MASFLAGAETVLGVTVQFVPVQALHEIYKKAG